MSKYLLVLLLLVVGSCKFRHLKNFTVATPSPPLIKCLSPTEIAYQYQTSIITLNLSSQAVLQNVSLPAATTIQVLPAQNKLLYLNQSTIYQISSNSKEIGFGVLFPDKKWTTPMAALG